MGNSGAVPATVSGEPTSICATGSNPGKAGLKATIRESGDLPRQIERPRAGCPGGALAILSAVCREDCHAASPTSLSSDGFENGEFERVRLYFPALRSSLRRTRFAYRKPRSKRLAGATRCVHAGRCRDTAALKQDLPARAHSHAHNSSRSSAFQQRISWSTNGCQHLRNALDENSCPQTSCSRRADRVDIGAVKLSYWDTGRSGRSCGAQSSELSGQRMLGLPAAGASQPPAIASSRGHVAARIRPRVDRRVIYRQSQMICAHCWTSLASTNVICSGAAEGAAGVLHFAIENPARVRSAILLGARLFVDEADYRSMNERACLAENHHAELHFFELGPSYRGANREGLDAWIANSAAAHPDGAFESQPWGGQKLTWARMEQLKGARSAADRRRRSLFVGRA